MNLLRWTALVAMAVPLFANDTLVTLGAGGLVPLKSAEIAMESEELQVSIHQITVRYVFRNKTNRDIDATVAFPLPPLNGGDLENEPMHLPSKDPLNFMDFRVTVDGKEVRPEAQVRAKFEDKDITQRLAALGLPVSVADKRFEADLAKLSRAQQDQLEKDEWIECYDGQPRRCGAYWTTEIQYHWRQRFPAGAAVAVEHSYRPVVGGAYMTGSMSGASSVRAYCGGADALARVAALKKRHPMKSRDDIVLWEKRVQYILTTANNWSGPIGNFKLTLLTDDSEDLLFTCMPGLKQVAPSRYEFAQANFRPAKELNVLILTAAKGEE
jgi:hypothetical protein